MIIRQGDDEQASMTLEQFKALVASPDWVRDMCSDVVDTDIAFIPKGGFNHWLTDFDNTLQVEKKIAWRGVNSMHGNQGIFYVESLSFNEHQPESFAVSTDKHDKNWCFQGLMVVGKDGDPIREDELIDCLPTAFSTITIGANEMVDTDADETLLYKVGDSGDNVFQDLLLESTYGRNIHASVHERAVASGSTPAQADEGRTLELKLYETQVGSYVCCRSRLVTKEDDTEIKEVAIVNSKEEIEDFFGSGWVASKLYKAAGIE